jgi:hypothetical protein
VQMRMASWRVQEEEEELGHLAVAPSTPGSEAIHGKRRQRAALLLTDARTYSVHVNVNSLCSNNDESFNINY